MPAISDDGVDLISNMILCNRKSRYNIKQVMEHSYFKNIDMSKLPEVVQKYMKQIRPPVIQYPLKINMASSTDKLKSGSTDTSTSREANHTKRKLELVSNQLIGKKIFETTQNVPEDEYQINIRR